MAHNVKTNVFGLSKKSITFVARLVNIIFAGHFNYFLEAYASFLKRKPRKFSTSKNGISGFMLSAKDGVDCCVILLVRLS